MEKVKVALYGVGAVGSLIAKTYQKKGVEIAGAVDIAEDLRDFQGFLMFIPFFVWMLYPKERWIAILEGTGFVNLN